MRSFVVVLILTLCVSVVAMAEGPGRLVGSVEAVYHEGLMTFQVNQADAVSASVRVYDLATDALIYDSGPRAQTLVSWPAGHDVEGAFRYVVTAWNEQGEVVVSQAAVTKTLDLPASIAFDTIPGDTKILGPNEVIIATDLQVGDTQAARIESDYSGHGGGLYLYEENGTTLTGYMVPDASGIGNYTHLRGGNTSSYFRWDGNYSGTNGTMHVMGASDFVVYTNNTGDSSVVMPASSVGSAEILNEAGVASAYSATALGITAAHNVLLRTISPPSAGYLVMSASVDVSINHSTGSSSNVSCSISTSSLTHDGNGDMTAGVSMNAPSGVFWQNVSMNRAIYTDGTSDTWYVVCTGTTGGSMNAYERHFNILFVPTSYGGVTEGMGDTDGDPELVEGYIPNDDHPITEADIDAERIESINANLARIQAELAAVQAQADALAAASDNNQP